MGRTIPAIFVGTLLLMTMIPLPAAAQQTPTDELREEVRALRQAVQEIRKELQELKSQVARQAPRPSGIGVEIDLGANPAKGDRTAKLTLVEFSDYQ